MALFHWLGRTWERWSLYTDNFWHGPLFVLRFPMQNHEVGYESRVFSVRSLHFSGSLRKQSETARKSNCTCLVVQGQSKLHAVLGSCHSSWWVYGTYHAVFPLSNLTRMKNRFLKSLEDREVELKADKSKGSCKPWGHSNTLGFSCGSWWAQKHVPFCCLLCSWLRIGIFMLRFPKQNYVIIYRDRCVLFCIFKKTEREYLRFVLMVTENN